MEQLKNFLDLVATEQTKEDLIEVSLFLSELGFKTHFDEINLIIVDGEDKDNLSILLEIKGLLNKYLENSCKKYGVTLENGVELVPSLKIARALHLAPNYGDREILLDILNEESTTILRLSEVVEVIEGMDSGRVAESLNDVSEDLLDKAITVIEAQLDPESISRNEPFIERFRWYEKINNPTLYKKVFSEGYNIGISLDIILDIVSEDLFGLVNNPNVFVNELVSLVLMSNVKEKDIKQTASDVTPEFIDNLDKISKINKLIIDTEVK